MAVTGTAGLQSLLSLSLMVLLAQECPHFVSLKATFKMIGLIKNTKHLLIYTYTEYSLYNTMHN